MLGLSCPYAAGAYCVAMSKETSTDHPQTKGIVERFNGRISELLKQTRFDSRADLEITLLNYPKLYSHHIPQRAIGSKTPVQALKEWQQKKPDLFVKRIQNQTRLDSPAVSLDLPGRDGTGREHWKPCPPG